MDTRKIRSATRRDAVDVIRLGNLLDLETGTCFILSDVPSHTEDVHALAIAMKHCRKRPGVFYRITNIESVRPLFALLPVVAKDADRVRNEGMLFYTCMVISPCGSRPMTWNAFWRCMTWDARLLSRDRW